MTYSQSIGLKTILNFEEFQKLRYDWNKLLEQSSSDRVFMTHEWFTCWWQAFGEGKRLFIVLAKNKEEIIGIAPLMIHGSTFRKMPIRSIGFMENKDSPGCGFIIKKGYEQIVAKAFITFLMEKIGNWEILFFKNMLYEKEIYDGITEILYQGDKKYIISNGLNSPFIKVENEWEEYFKSISNRSKKTIRNVCNRMKKLGNIKVKEFSNMKVFDDIVSITKNGWKYQEGKAFINRRDREKFFRLLSKVAQENGWLSIWCVYKDNDPIAYEYHLKYRQSDTALLAEYNRNYSNFSPGTFLDFEIIKSLFNSEICEYDMCGSPDKYKKKWTEDVRQYKNLIIFNNSIYSNLLYFMETKLIKKIKNIRDKVKALNNSRDKERSKVKDKN